MKNFENPLYPGNGQHFHTGKPCIEDGCERPAGTAWSPHWCFECNAERMRRIGKQISELRGETQ